MHSRRALFLGLATSLSMAHRGLAQPVAAPVRVAAASDLKFALDEIATAYTTRTGQKIEIVYGSSGNFRRQIAQGAPFDLFFSADESYVFALADTGLAQDRGHRYAQGRLVLYAPHGAPFSPDDEWTDFRRALTSGTIRRFAIANPDHAPYGRAAAETLRHTGLWPAIAPLLVLGENVSQAAQFAISGSAQGGLFALSLAMTPQVTATGRYVLVPEGWHAPLVQRMVVLARASRPAADFGQFCRSDAARAILRRYGFAMPDGQ